MPSTIFSGNKIKTLKDTLTLNGKADIISSTTDPTSVAVDAPIGSILINSTTGIQYKKLDAGSSTNWSVIGTGSGVKNWIPNGDAEGGTTGWATYADAAGSSPVDGTGGSPTVTFTDSSSSPLDGLKSFLITKDAANRQGEGASAIFTLPAGFVASMHTIRFRYSVLSGTYATGDVSVWVYDVTNAALIAVAPTSLMNTGIVTEFTGQFQTSATGASYRLIFHVASTSASAYVLKIDDVVVTPTTYAYGAVVTDPVAYTPTFTGFGTVSNVSFISRRVGSHLEIQGKFTSGTSTAVEARIGLGFIGVSGNVSVSSLYTSNQLVGSGAHGSATTQGFTVLANGGQTYLTLSQINTANPPLASQNGSSLIISGQVLSIYALIPIQGWSSNVVVSDQADTRVVAAKMSSSTTTVSSATKVVFATTEYDTHGALSGGDTYTVKVPGKYIVTSHILGAAVSQVLGGSFTIDLYKNGSFSSTIASTASGVAATYRMSGNGATEVDCVAGDTLDIRVSQNASGALPAGAANAVVTFRRASGSAQIAASDKVNVKATTAGTTIGTTDTTVIFGTVVYDTNGSYNSATGIFTAPKPAKYRVTATTRAAAVTSSGANRNVYMMANKNGSNNSWLAETPLPAAVTALPLTWSGTTTIQCLAGDTISVIMVRDSNVTSFSLQNSATTTQLEIEEVGNY
jgi:hypothetical protein